MASQPIVEAVGLVKVFDDFWLRAKARAVDGIDFEIRPNEIFGLLGPNGSGKSTTIKMILGLLRKTKGRLSVFGRDPGDVSVKARIGYLPEESYMYRFLNPLETLDYYGKLFGIARSVRRRRSLELLDMVGLEGASHRAVGEFSKGMSRRLGIAQALINDPEFLILDEPTSGLDPIGTKQVKDLLLDLGRRGKTILLSSHLLADVEDVCDRMVVLYGGKIRASGTTQALLADTNRTMICLPRVRAQTIEKIDALVRAEEGMAIERVEAPRQRLEDLFVQIVEQARVEQTSTSGALQGGKTAAFLLGDHERDVPEEIVADLQREPRSSTPAHAVVANPPSEPANESVLSDLIASATPPTRVKPTPAERPPTGNPALDRQVIDDLLEKPPEQRG